MLESSQAMHGTDTITSVIFVSQVDYMKTYSPQVDTLIYYSRVIHLLK